MYVSSYVTYELDYDTLVPWSRRHSKFFVANFQLYYKYKVFDYVPYFFFSLNILYFNRVEKSNS